MTSSSPSSAHGASGTIASSIPMTIRVAQYRDLPGLAELLVDSFHHHTGWLRLFQPLLRLGTQEDLRHRIGSGSSTYICLVAVTQRSTPTLQPSSSRLSPRSVDYLVGTIEMTLQATAPWQLRKGQYLYISSLAVRQTHRRCGIARQLLLNCEKTARIMGYHDLYLHVMENNHPAQQLYLAMGYQLQQNDPDWLALLPGQPRRLLLHKHLLPLSPYQQPLA